MNNITKVAYVVTIISSILGVLTIRYGVKNAQTVFQEIEAMIDGLCYVIIPYCIARAIEKIMNDSKKYKNEDFNENSVLSKKEVEIHPENDGVSTPPALPLNVRKA